MNELMNRLLVRLQQARHGQAMVEYALILVLVSVIAIVMLTLIGTEVNIAFNNVAQRLAGATP